MNEKKVVPDHKKNENLKVRMLIEVAIVNVIQVKTFYLTAEIFELRRLVIVGLTIKKVLKLHGEHCCGFL